MDAADVARRVADALADRSIPYAIGGAIAYGFFGAPRGTWRLDRAYVRRWLVDTVGESDARVAKWDSLCGQLPEPR